MNKTENYQLSLWDKADRLLMADFNEDNAKLDAALANLRDGKANSSELTSTAADLRSVINSKTRIIYGTYSGNDAETQFISLGATPVAVFLCPSSGHCTSGYLGVSGLVVQGHEVIFDGKTALTIDEGGFTVYFKRYGNSSWAAATNSTSYTYHYIAFC